MDTTDESRGDRWARGVAVMERIQGAEAAAAIRDGFERVFPDDGRYVVEAGFADVYDRPGLDLRARQIVTVAALVALGGCESQLATHVRGALHVGVAPAELFEVVLQLSLYAGHPRAGNALRVLSETCAEQGVELPGA